MPVRTGNYRWPVLTWPTYCMYKDFRARALQLDCDVVGWRAHITEIAEASQLYAYSSAYSRICYTVTSLLGWAGHYLWWQEFFIEAIAYHKSWELHKPSDFKEKFVGHVLQSQLLSVFVCLWLPLFRYATRNGGRQHQFCPSRGEKPVRGCIYRTYVIFRLPIHEHITIVITIHHRFAKPVLRTKLNTISISIEASSKAGGHLVYSANIQKCISSEFKSIAIAHALCSRLNAW